LRGGADKEKALAMLAETWDLATSLGDRILMGRVANNVGIVHFSSGDYEAGLKHFQRALRVRKGIGYRRGLVVNLHNVGDAQFRLGRKGLAWSAFEESYLLAKEIGWRKSALLNEAFLSFLRATEAAGLDIGKPTLDGAFSEKVEDPSELTRDLERIARESDALPAPLSAAVARWLTGRLLIGVQQIGPAIDVLQVAHQNALSVNEMAFLRDVESDLEVARALEQKSNPVS